MSTNSDHIGIPFPKDHEAFKDDKPLLRKIFRIESLVEIGHDLDDVMGLLTATLKLQSDVHQSILLAGGIFGLIPSTLGQSAVLLYVRCFNESKGRTRLEPLKVFSSTLQLEFHDLVCDIRNQFIAHQSSSANQHDLFVMQSSHNCPVTLKPSGESSRLIFDRAIEASMKWEHFIGLVKAAQQYVKMDIKNLCEAVERGLSKEQIDAINSIDAIKAKNAYLQKRKVKNQSPFETRSGNP